MQQYRLGASRTESIFAEKVMVVLVKQAIQIKTTIFCIVLHESSQQVEWNNFFLLVSTCEIASGILCPV